MTKYILAMLIAILLSGCQPIQVKADNVDRQFAYNVTSKLLGENTYSEESFKLLACTVKNRIDRGWKTHNVLNAYNGYPQVPEEYMIDFVSDVLSSNDCPAVYFAFGIGDLPYLKNASSVEPLFVASGIYYYSYEQFSALTQ